MAHIAHYGKGFDGPGMRKTADVISTATTIYVGVSLGGMVGAELIVGTGAIALGTGATTSALPAGSATTAELFTLYGQGSTKALAVITAMGQTPAGRAALLQVHQLSASLWRGATSPEAYKMITDIQLWSGYYARGGQ